MSGPPDPEASRAVLVGVSEYEKMPPERQLPTVRSGLYRLAELLCDKRLWGLPRENCTVLHQPPDADAVVRALRAAAGEAGDTLLFYYAGHGLMDPALQGDELHLALPGCYEPGGTHLALRYNHVRREFQQSRHATRRVVILDCCWSGLAADSAIPGGQRRGELVEAAAIQGAAVLTATAATKKALAPQDEDYPAFTGALIETLDRGVRGGPRLLDVATVYQRLLTALGDRGRPQPEFAGRGSGAQIGLAWNVAWQGQRREPVPVHAAEQVLALRRAGRYREADELQRRAAETGEPGAIRERAAELRRSGRYEDAAELERMDRP